MPAYFDAYERVFDLQVRRPVRVSAVRPSGRDLEVETDTGTWTTRALISATGTWTRPFRPRYPGAETFRGRQLHTVDYAGPEEFAGKRVRIFPHHDDTGDSAANRWAEQLAEACADVDAFSLAGLRRTELRDRIDEYGDISAVVTRQPTNCWRICRRSWRDRRPFRLLRDSSGTTNQQLCSRC